MEDFKKNHQEDEIDLLQLFQTVWGNRKVIVRFVVVFALLGLFIAVFSAKEYTASTVVVPQVDSEKGGSLGGIAAMAGINLGGNSGQGIPPTLYPQVVRSIPFQRELLQVPLTFSDIDKQVSYQEYYKDYGKFNLLSFLKKYTIGLPGVILGALRGEENEKAEGVGVDNKIHTISKEEKGLFLQIQQQLAVDNNDKEGFVTLSFSMPEALPAAQMTQKAQELLQEAVTKFKIEKAQEELKFIEERCQAAKKDFDKKQIVLASFRDRNRGISTSRSRTREERLQSDYNLAFGVYSELAKKLEAQKIKVKENTPVFTIIDPVSVPVEKSKPKRAMILAIWLFLGVVIGVGWVFGKEWVRNLKENDKKDF